MTLPLFRVKAALAFAAPVALALLLGWLGWILLRDAGERADVLAAQAAARAELAGLFERRVVNAAYNLRGFIVNGEKTYLDQAKKNLTDAAAVWHEAKASAQGSGRAARWTTSVKVGAEEGAVDKVSPGGGPSGAVESKAPAGEETAESDDVARLGYLLDEYKKQAELVVSLYETLGRPREDFEAARGKCAEAVAAGVAETRDKLAAGLDLKYPPLDKVRLRVSQMERLYGFQEAAASVYEAYVKARLDRKPGLLGQALERLDAALSDLAAYEESGQEEAARGAAIRTASLDFREAAENLLGEWRGLEGAGQKLLRDEKSLLEAASALSTKTMTAVRRDAADLASGLAWDGRWSLIALLAAGGLGLVLIGLGVWLTAVPLTRCARFARAVVKGRLNEPLAVSGRDEAGLLADCLREIAKRFGRSWAR